MLIVLRDICQGSPEWFEARCGMVGGTGISKIVTSSGKRSTQRKQYLYQLAAEKITGQKTETFCSPAMKQGIERESNTRMEFQLATFKEIEQVGGVTNTGIEGAFVSPDGLVVGEEAGLELKSVQPATQVKYLDKGVLPTEYRLQCQMSMFVTGWPVWYFCSHCPGLPIFYLPVERDEKLISIINSELQLFVSDLKKLVEKIN